MTDPTVPKPHHIDKAIAALREIEAHHVEINSQVGRALADSKTLRLARKALSALGEQPNR